MGPSWCTEKGSIENVHPRSTARNFQARRPRSKFFNPRALWVESRANPDNSNRKRNGAIKRGSVQYKGWPVPVTGPSVPYGAIGSHYRSSVLLTGAFKSWWEFRPRKKIFSPPPPPFLAATLPAPRPPRPPGRPPPLLGFSVKSRSPPSWRLGLPLPLPRAGKKYIRNVH